MKTFLGFSLVLFTLLACNNQPKEQTSEKKLTELELIANAYGIANFDKLSELRYEFNVQRDTSTSKRCWLWQKNTGRIMCIINNDTTNYTQGQVSDDMQKTDHRFINDKYWLLFPFQLVWDDSITYTNNGLTPAPISGDNLLKITIQYGSEGGYTPGDAYDLYVDNDWIIREWTYRKSGQAEPSLSTTWEGYTEIAGIKVALDHYNNDRSLRLFFTGVSFE